MESSECTSVSLDDKKILKELEDKNLNKHYVKMMEFRQKLPSYARREVFKIIYDYKKLHLTFD
jgi:hypothetical protein